MPGVVNEPRAALVCVKGDSCRYRPDLLVNLASSFCCRSDLTSLHVRHISRKSMAIVDIAARTAKSLSNIGNTSKIEAPPSIGQSQQPYDEL